MEDSKKGDTNEGTNAEAENAQTEDILTIYNLVGTKKAFEEHAESARSVVAAAQFLEKSIADQMEFGKFRYLSIRAFKEFVRRRLFLTCGVVSSHIAQFNARFTERERTLRAGSAANVALLKKARIDPDIQSWLAERTPSLAKFRVPAEARHPSSTEPNDNENTNEEPLNSSNSSSSNNNSSRHSRPKMYLSDLISMRRYEQRFRDLFEEHGKLHTHTRTYNKKLLFIFIHNKLYS